MRVSERMRREVVTVEPHVPLQEASDLMTRHGIRHLPVVKDGRLVGIVTDRDLRRAWPSNATSLEIREVYHRLATAPVQEAMTSGVLTVSPRTPLAEAARLMRDRRIGALPVLDGSELVGILTESDLVETLLALL